MSEAYGVDLRLSPRLDLRVEDHGEDEGGEGGGSLQIKRTVSVYAAEVLGMSSLFLRHLNSGQVKQP